MAVSKDGLKGWNCLDTPVLSPGNETAWDAGGIGSPCAVSMEGESNTMPITEATNQRGFPKEEKSFRKACLSPQGKSNLAKEYKGTYQH